MYSFDAMPMAPIGTECMIHIKPTRRQTLGYHAIKAWYCAPALNHYCCIKAVTDSGAIRLTDTFKFLHHTLAMPVISDADRIIKATQQLQRAITGNLTANEDELTAIQHLQALISGAVNTTPPDEQTLDPHNKPDPPAVAPDQVTLPDPVPVQVDAPPAPTQPNTPSPRAQHIPYDEVEYKQPIDTTQQYNLQSQGAHLIQHTTETTKNIPQLFVVHADLDKESGKILEYRHLMKHPKYAEAWTTSYANELGRLTQGICGIPGTNTMFFIHKHEIPADRLKDITFSKIVTDFHPQKAEPNRTRLTVVGTYINYPWDVATPTSDLTTTKLLFNSVISTPGAAFLGMDLKNFYLNTPMDRPEYMKLKLALIPEEIIVKYKLCDKQHDGWVYVQIDLVMYGLPQAGILANKLLMKRLAQAGYHPCQFTPGLWRHVWHPIAFCLVVDDLASRLLASACKKPQTSLGTVL
eukprot:CCRYP_006028-RA/>CCRYP_006028-RA protein AED:0.37 eAED:0.37 QI:0/-1/0/1/-1/1/1/0/464